MKKMEIEGKLYSVMTPNEYAENKDIYNPRNVALEIQDKVLPIRNRMIDGTKAIGVYYNREEETEKKQICHIINKPSEEQEDKYSKDKIIDLTKPKSIEEVIEKSKIIRDIQSDLMVSSSNSNIFYLSINPEDTPEMTILKKAINSKQVDKRNYEDRFSQFQNDMRLLKGNTITLSKLISICNGFDISAVLTLRDKEGAVNPMEVEFNTDLTDREVK